MAYYSKLPTTTFVLEVQIVACKASLAKQYRINCNESGIKFVASISGILNPLESINVQFFQKSQVWIKTILR